MDMKFFYNFRIVVGLLALLKSDLAESGKRAVLSPECVGGYSQMVSDSHGKLNTEALADRFGPITTELISQDEDSRKVWFRDAHGIPRGYAVSRLAFKGEAPTVLALAHRQIVNGGSMGKTFKDFGFTIKKAQLNETVEALPVELREPLGAAMGTRRRYIFTVVTSDGREYSYAHVEEWTPR